MKTENTMHNNLMENYIAVLKEVVLIINGNLKLVTDAPSINIGKYYLSEANLLRVGTKGGPEDKILYLTKVHEVKKHINFLNKLGADLLKDVITYSNKYKLDEVMFFEDINEIVTLSKLNLLAISESIAHPKNEIAEMTLKEVIDECEGIIHTYYKTLTIIRRNLDSEDYNFGIFFKNNLYKNIKRINYHINIETIADINTLIRKNKLLKLER